jgi:hypothetical protein
MHKKLSATALAIGLAGWAPAAAAQQPFSTTCTATAGLDKHEAATSTTGTERTGSYDVTLSTGARTVELTAKPKKPVAAGEATKVAADIDRVLLRSPVKSEATALPARESRGPGGEHRATFDLGAIRALPDGDVNVVIVTPDGERVCRVDKAHREKLAR